MKYRWIKKVMVFDTRVHSLPHWAEHSVLQPTPILLDSETIRFYAGMRDEKGQSRVGYIDVLSSDPRQVVNISQKPVLNLGKDGYFDDCGVVPSAITNFSGKYYMYYAGYSLLKKVRFSVLGGLAESDDGVNFTRCSTVPIFERTSEHALFRVAHTILKKKGMYMIWYGGGNHFFEMNGYTYPVYDIYLCETDNLSKITNVAQRVLTFQNDDEYRVARPYVVYRNGLFCMFLCVATKSKGYRLGYAESTNGYEWIRCDEKLGIDVSLNDDWDSQMMGYPSFLETKYGAYLFYNGNEYGRYGFGYAELINN